MYEMSDRPAGTPIVTLAAVLAQRGVSTTIAAADHLSGYFKAMDTYRSRNRGRNVRRVQAEIHEYATEICETFRDCLAAAAEASGTTYHETSAAFWSDDPKTDSRRVAEIVRAYCGDWTARYGKPLTRDFLAN